jgi:hypothetical protein
MKENQFTQKVKNDWLNALKSGDFIQGQCSLKYIDKNDETRHCCIGVLGEIHPSLKTNPNDQNENPYYFLEYNLGDSEVEEIWKTNDNTFSHSKPDYSNVIPLIELLPTKD